MSDLHNFNGDATVNCLMSVVAIPIDYVILFFIFYSSILDGFFLRFVQRRLFKLVTLSYIVQFGVFFVVVVNYYVDRAKKNRQN